MTALDTYSGQFKVIDGTLDVTTGYGVRYSVASQNDCTVSIDANGVYTVTEVSDDNANAIFVAKYNGLSIYKTFTIAKSRETGGPGTAKRIVLNTTNYDFAYDEKNQPAVETALLNVSKYNTTADTLWRLRKLDETIIIEGTAATLVSGGYVTSSANPDQITINQISFNNLISNNSTNAIVVETEVLDGTTLFRDRVTLFQLIQKNKVTWEGISDPTGSKQRLVQQAYDSRFVANELQRALDDITSRQVQTASSLHINIDRVERETDEQFVLEQTARTELGVALSGQIGDVAADLVTEQTVRAGETAALAFQITDITADVADVSAALTIESSARATQDTALANSITILNTSLGTTNANLTSEITARTNADSALTSLYNSLNSSLGTTNANLTSEATTRASADSALSTSVTTLQNRLNLFNGSGGTVEAWANTTTTALSTEASTRASQDTALQADYNGQFGTVNSTLSTQVSKMGVVENRWTIALNAGGNATAGLVLANGSNSKSIFAVQADKFYVYDSSGAGQAPFYVTGGTTYIDAAVIKNGDITNAKLGTASVGTANIQNLAVDTLQVANNAITIPLSAYTAGDASLTSGSAQSVQSLTINSTGAPIQVHSYVVLYKSGTLNSASVTVDLRRDGSTIYTYNTQIFQFYENPIIFSFADTPGAGSHTYEIYVTAGASSWVARKRFIGLLETKK